MKKLKIETLTNDSTINLALDTIRMGKQALVFANTKRSAEKTAEEIAKKIKEEKDEWNKLSEEVLHALARPTQQCERLAKCIKKGIAYHHAGLVHRQKDLIEENFKKGIVKIICATPTLAYGVDLPAFRSIIKDLRRYGHRGLDFIPVLEYLQMAGRAGRPNYDKEGQAIAIADTESEKEKIYKRYILGKPEEITSKLAVEPVLRTYLLSILASNFVNTKKRIMEFFEKTFWAHQFEDMGRLENVIEKMLGLLEEWEFVMSNCKDFRNADELEDTRYRVTSVGRRVSELYIDPLTAYFMIQGLQKTAGRKVNEFSFLQLISHTLEMRPLLNVRMKEYDHIQEEFIKNGYALLEEEPSLYEEDYEDFLKSVKTALFFMEWINEKDEEHLLENFNIRPGEVRIKIGIADWLLYAMEEFCRILHYQNLIKEATKLRFRVRYGVKEELLTLLQLEHIGRVRARKLYNNRIRDIKDVRNADIGILTQLLGKETALKVKKQVDQDFEKIAVREGKRKGQISLVDYYDRE